MFELLSISEWIIPQYGKWELKENAPQSVKKIFYKFQKAYSSKEGKIIE